jgi:hypothetical protein
MPHSIPLVAHVLSVEAFDKRAHIRKIKGEPVFAKGVRVQRINKVKEETTVKRVRRRISVLVQMPGAAGNNAEAVTGLSVHQKDNLMSTMHPEDEEDLALVPTMRNVHWDPLLSQLVIDRPQFPFDMDSEVQAKDLPKLVAAVRFVWGYNGDTMGTMGPARYACLCERK